MNVAAIVLLALLPSQQKDPDQVHLTVTFKDTPLDKVLDQIQTMTKIPIEWSEDAKKKVNPKDVKVDIEIQDMSVTGALKLLLLSQGLDAKAVDKKKILITVSQ